MADMSINLRSLFEEPTGLTGGDDPSKYDVFRKAIGDIAAQTRDVSAPGYENLAKIVGEATTPTKQVTGKPDYESLYRPPGILGHRSSFGTAGFRRTIRPDVETLPQTPEQIQLEAAIQSFRGQFDVKKKEAGKAATALEMQGAATVSHLERLDELQREAYARRERTADIWASVAEKADEYVKAAQSRTQQALDRLDKINSEISEGRDFAKAHAMQAAVQGVIGSLKQQEDQVVQRYGLESKEYQMFQMKKAQTLSTAQSQIESSHQQMAEQQGVAYMNASTELQWKEDMYSSFQEQQHVETLRYMAQANDAYDLQLSQFNLTVEQMRSAGMENMANWIVQTPVFSMDIQPLATLVAQLLPRPAMSMVSVRARKKVPSATSKPATSKQTAPELLPEYEW